MNRQFSWAAADGRGVLAFALCCLLGVAWSAAAPGLAAAQELTFIEQLDLADAAAKNEQVFELYGQRRYAEAIALAEEVLAIRRKVLGEEHPDTATSLNDLGLLLRESGDYAAARPYYEQALTIYRKVLGEEHADTATSLNNLGALLYAMGDYAAARPYYEQALAICRKVLGEEHPNTTEALNNLGALLLAMGDYVAARPYFEQALAIKRKVLGEEHPDTATSLSNLGALLEATGDYAAARLYYQQALAIYRKVLGDEHAYTTTLLNKLGALLYSLGEYVAARPYYEQALSIRRKVLGEEHPDTATSLNNLGALLLAMGDYVAARPYFEQALAIRRKVLGDEHAYTATSLNNLGALLESTGDYAAARPYFEQALEINRKVLGEEHPETALSLNNMGSSLQATGDYAAARPYYEQALAIYRNALGEEHPDTAVSLSNMGSLHLATGDYAAARPYFEQALAIRRKVLGEEHPDTALSLNNMGALLEATGDYVAARPYHEQALAIVAKLVEATALAQNETGQLRMSQSVQFYLDSYVSLLMETGGGDAEAYRAVLNWKGATLVRQRAARLVADNEELAPLLAELQSVVRQWSALVTGPPQADVRWQERLAALARDKERLELELSRRSAAFRAGTVELSIAELQQALPDGAALVDYYEFWFTKPSADKPGRRDRRRSLAAFVVRPDGDVAMCDLGEVAPIHAAIDEWRKSFGASVASQQAGKLLREKLWAPLEEVIGDAELVLVSPDGALGNLPFAALPGRAPGTYLIEDVALALVPVPRLIPELVRSPGGNDATLDRELLLVGGVDYDSRGESLAPPAPPVGELYAVVRSRGVARETTEGLAWDALQGTHGEVTAIGELAQSWGGWPEAATAVLSGAAATEENFRTWAPRSRILHLATHGFFAPEDKRSALVVTDPDALRDDLSAARTVLPEGFDTGLLSGLVLAGANDPPALPEEAAAFASLPEDGILTAEELAFLPLTGVELAVLSACETGLGEVAGGEGLLGIQRAFQISGVRTTVATLWKVDDAMTQRLMTAFYRNALERKKSYLEALRNAQLEILRELRDPQGRAALLADSLRGADAPADAASVARGAPYYWAAFTLSGDWR